MCGGRCGPLSPLSWWAWSALRSRGFTEMHARDASRVRPLPDHASRRKRAARPRQGRGETLILSGNGYLEGRGDKQSCTCISQNFKDRRARAVHSD
jgi:hypothetical protein